MPTGRFFAPTYTAYKVLILAPLLGLICFGDKNGANNNTYQVELSWGLNELLNVKFSEEGLGIQHTFPIIIIILLLVLHELYRGKKMRWRKSSDSTSLAIYGSLNMSFDFSSEIRMTSAS